MNDPNARLFHLARCHYQSNTTLYGRTSEQPAHDRERRRREILEQFPHMQDSEAYSDHDIWWGGPSKRK